MGSEVRLIPDDTSVETLWNTSRNDGVPFLIGTEGRLIGIVSARQLAAAFEAGRNADSVGALVDAKFVHAHPDHPSETVLERLAHSGGVLPIVSRDDVQQLLGIVTFPHIMQFMRTRPGASSVPCE
jgi:CBS domain-containing protein